VDFAKPNIRDRIIERVWAIQGLQYSTSPSFPLTSQLQSLLKYYSSHAQPRHQV
jgi:hypothetical protein